MTINVSSLGGGGAGFKLAPDLNYVSNNVDSARAYRSVNIDPSSGLTTALSLSGKFAVSGISLAGITSGAEVDIELIIDGVTIINDTFNGESNDTSIIGEVGNLMQAGYGAGITTVCENSLVLKLNCPTDASVSVFYIARPIL